MSAEELNVHEARDEFTRNGVFLAKGLLDRTTIDSAMASLKTSFDQQLEFLGLPPPESIEASMGALFDADLERYKKTAASLWRKMSVYNLCHDPRIQEFVTRCFGWDEIMVPGGQVVHIQAERLRIPGGYFGLVPHQDFPSVQGSLDGIVVWIPLVDIDANRYPLEVIPGSHKQGILPSFENENSTWEVKPEFYEESDFVAIECERGDVAFMSNFTVHRSSQTGDFRLRLACSTRYDNLREPTYIERAYPTAYLRSVKRQLD